MNLLNFYVVHAHGDTLKNVSSELIRVIPVRESRHRYTQPHVTQEVTHVCRFKLHFNRLSERPCGIHAGIEDGMRPVILSKVCVSFWVIIKKRIFWVFGKEVCILLSNSFK